MKYKVKMITRESNPEHPAAKEYFDAEFGHVLIVVDDKNWWYAKDFLRDIYYGEDDKIKKEKDFEIEIKEK